MIISRKTSLLCLLLMETCALPAMRRFIAKWWDLRNNLSVKKTHVNVNRVLIMLSPVLSPVRVDRVNALHSGTTTSYSEYPWHKKYSQLAGLAVS